LDDLKLITASNIIKLRTGMGLTQAELGERLNYSDKSVSKWERGEALPDAWVLKRMAEIFGVSVDYMLKSHDEWEGLPEDKKPEVNFSSGVVMIVSVIGIWTLALFLFIVFWMLGSMQWIIFAAAVPVMLITLLVFNSVWRHGRENMWIVAALVLSVIVLCYLFFLRFNPWQLMLLIVPAELIVYFSFHIRKR